MTLCSGVWRSGPIFSLHQEPLSCRVLLPPTTISVAAHAALQSSATQTAASMAKPLLSPPDVSACKAPSRSENSTGIFQNPAPWLSILRSSFGLPTLGWSSSLECCTYRGSILARPGDGTIATFGAVLLEAPDPWSKGTHTSDDYLLDVQLQCSFDHTI